MGALKLKDYHLRREYLYPCEQECGGPMQVFSRRALLAAPKGK